MRYVREEEVIAQAIRTTRRGVRDTQRPTGTEKARTAEVAAVVTDTVGFIAERQDGQDAAIGEALQEAEAASVAADAAGTAAGTARAMAAAADGKALVAQEQAQSVQSQFTAHQAVFRVTSGGAEVASSDGANVFAMTPAGAQIIQGGTAASTWDAGRFIVNETVVNRAQLANHVVEKSGTARTVFRPV